MLVANSKLRWKHFSTEFKTNTINIETEIEILKIQFEIRLKTDSGKTFCKIHPNCSQEERNCLNRIKCAIGTGRYCVKVFVRQKAFVESLHCSIFCGDLQFPIKAMGKDPKISLHLLQNYFCIFFRVLFFLSLKQSTLGQFEEAYNTVSGR